jgi:hypothetical protein
MRPQVNVALRLEDVEGELLALDPAGGVVVRLSEEERAVVQRLQANDQSDGLPVTW